MGEALDKLINEIASMDEANKINAINNVKKALHEISPFKTEPVDCVLWMPAEQISANDYNPNAVATPEMKLLQLSIGEDGYTQPIVAWGENGHYEVIDGFHRNRVGKECEDVRNRIHGYLPITLINGDRQDKADRIASTIRHNRARGKHQVAAMSDIILELARRNWNDKKIGKELGMEPDEVLRLKQITGLAELFANEEFSEAWD
ncbi:MAG: ParB/RepB/Spo0J family partition protein [Selenomonadaceae bacterium]